MTRFPSPLTTAMLLLLLSVAATAAETGPFSLETEDGHDVLAPFAPVPIEPEPASRSLASCTNTEKKKFKVTDENGKPLTGKKNCKGWAKLKKCDSLVKNKPYTVASVCAKACVTNTKKNKFKVKNETEKGKKNCNQWAKLDKCNSMVNNKDFTVSSWCGKSCNECGAAPTDAPSEAPSATPTPEPCTDSKVGGKKKFKVTDENGKVEPGKKNCKKWAKLKKCDSMVNNKKFTVASVCKKSCVTNTITKKFQVKGPLKKKCDYWAKNDHCTSKKNNGEPVFTVCEKSCNHCGEAPSAAPTTTWQPSATFTPTATWAPSATFAPTDTHPPSNTKEPSTTPPN